MLRGPEDRGPEREETLTAHRVNAPAGGRVSRAMTSGNKSTMYLQQNGWRLVAGLKKRNAIGINLAYQAWDHPAHQPDRHGFFTKTTALDHQKMLDKNGGICDCIKENS